MPPKKQELSSYIDDNIKPMETKSSMFVPIAKAQKRQGVKAFLWGEFGTGKTYTALSFPAPIHVISTEFGVTSLAHHFPGKDIRVLECAIPFTPKPVHADASEDDQPFATDPVMSLKMVEEATNELKDVTEGTIIVDSVSDIWAWLGNWLDYIAKKNVSKSSGKEFMMRTEWQKANAKYRWLMMRLLSRPCNVVLTSRAGPVYDATGNITAATKAKAQQETSYYVDIVAKLENRPGIDPKGNITGHNERMATIQKCRFADVDNLQIKDLTYDNLKAALKSKVPAEVF